MKNLLLPCAGKSTRFPNMRPKWALTHPTGKLMLEEAIKGIDVNQFDRIIVTIVKEHDTKYDVTTILKQSLGEKIEICILNEFTNGPAETIFQTIKLMKVKGSIVIKDSDNYVLPIKLPAKSNFSVGLDISEYSKDISRLSNKSYIDVNENNQIVNYVEKKIISSYIGLGIYGFESSEQFIDAFNKISENQISGEIFISHIIAHMISTNEHIFEYVKAIEYEDWGTLEDWRRTQKKYRTYFVDVDGVLIKNSGQFGKINWDNNFELIDANIEILKKLQSEGAQIILTTSRPKKYRKILINIFSNKGLSIQDIITNCNHSTSRVLINDFAHTNPFPTSIAINLPRNGNLAGYLNE